MERPAFRLAVSIRFRLRRCWIPVLLALALQSYPAFGQTEWNGSQSSSWFNGLNWTPVGPPGGDWDVVIDTIQPHSTVIGLADANAGQLTVGFSAEGQLQIQSGFALESTGTCLIGDLAGSSGHVQLSGAGSQWILTGGVVHVGNHGTGELEILSGASMSAGFVSIADEAGSLGELRISGSASQLAHSANLIVGSGGLGTVQVLDGGQLQSGSFAFLGGGSQGLVEVSGPDSWWSLAGEMRLEGIGSQLEVINQGRVDSTESTIGTNVGDAASVTIAGSGSEWDIGGGLRVGLAGLGELNVVDGGRVDAWFANLGEDAGSSGNGHLSGAFSELDVIGVVQVAVNGSGSLVIDEGASVSAALGQIARYEGSVGTVVVNNGELFIDDFLGIGTASDGELLIENGGRVINVNSSVGGFTSGNGLVRVADPGSEWTLTGNLNIGSAGQGELVVSSGATLDSGLSTLGAGSTAQGIVTVDGAGSVWTSTDRLRVGLEGTGAMQITDGGTVVSTVGAIGNDSSGAGVVTLQGGLAVWSIASNLVIGLAGSGALHILDSSSVVVGGVTVVADEPGATGLLQVNEELISHGGMVINAGGVLTGSGTLDNGGSGNAAQVSGALRPGDPVGTLTLPDLLLTADAVLEFDLDQPGGSGDRLTVAGSLVLDGELRVNDLGNFGPGNYLLMTYTGLLNDQGLEVGVLPAGVAASVDLDTPGEVRLIVVSDELFTDRFEQL